MLRGTPRSFPLSDPIETSGYNAPALGDVDRDGDMDLIMGVLGGAFNPNRSSVENLYQFAQDADGEFRAATSRLIRTLDVGSESIPAFNDLDGDGDLDLLLSNKIDTESVGTGHLYVFENTGSATAPAFTERGMVPGLPDAYHHAPAFGDLDGDGDDDVLMGEWRDRMTYYRNDGPRGGRGADAVLPRWTLVDSAAATLTRGRNTTPTLGDLDGDGDLDLLVGESSGALNYYRNDGGARSPDFELVSDEFQDIDIGPPQRAHPRRSGRRRRPGSRGRVGDLRRQDLHQRGLAQGAGLRGDRPGPGRGARLQHAGLRGHGRRRRPRSGDGRGGGRPRLPSAQRGVPVNLADVRAVIDSAKVRDEGRLEDFIRATSPNSTDREVADAASVAIEVVETVPLLLARAAQAAEERGLGVVVNPLLDHAARYFIIRST